MSPKLKCQKTKMSSKKKFLSDLASKLLILFKYIYIHIYIFCDESSQTYVLENILPLNSIPSKFSELDEQTK